jgi:hypothetical protein
MSEPGPHARKVACRGYVFDDFTSYGASASRLDQCP